MIGELAFYGLILSSVGGIAALLYPALVRLWVGLATRMEQYHERRTTKVARLLDEIFVDVKPRWLNVASGILPLAGGVGLFLAFNNLFLAGMGAVLGFMVPDWWVRMARAQRKRKFQAQLVDALFILSSSLRAGLSLTQAFEQLEVEMPPPASQEFSLVMKAYRLGCAFEDALQGLNNRMPCDELNLITTTVMVARETGGNITGILGQLIATIREKKKLKEKVQTLTVQGRLQAYIMSALPLLFASFIRISNPGYFKVMLEEPVGHAAMAVAVVLWFVGIVLVVRISKVEV